MPKHKQAEALRAIADAKELQYRYDSRDSWKDMREPVDPFRNPDFEWRVKPKPPIVDVIRLHYDSFIRIDYDDPPNVRLTFDPDTKQLIKVELI